MQVVCPHCGEKIPSANINIQRMTAVCPVCDAVFNFDLADTRVKRRKVKPPQHLALDETERQVTIAFRTNFRLDKSEAFLTSAGLSLFTTFLTVFLINRSFSEPGAAFVAMGFGLITVFLYYSLALLAYNKTHIEISDDQIEVSRKPIPNPLAQSKNISLSGIRKIRYEETPTSKERGYDTPRYNVWADTVDGNRKFIVSDVIEDYAVFITQRLNELLEEGISPDLSRLSDDERITDEENAPAESLRIKR